MGLIGPPGIIIPLAWIWFALLVIGVVGAIVDERRRTRWTFLRSIERDSE